MNPGYLSLILIVGTLILVYFRSVNLKFKDHSLSLMSTSICLLSLFVLTKFTIPVGSRIEISVGSFLCPSLLFLVALRSNKSLIPALTVMLISVNVVLLNEILLKAPIAIFISMPVMISFLSAFFGFLLMKDQLVGLLSSWIGVTVGDGVFQLIHFKQMESLLIGGYAILDAMLLTGVIYAGLNLVNQFIVDFLKRREPSG